jgi:hypothetical protein
MKIYVIINFYNAFDHGRGARIELASASFLRLYRAKSQGLSKTFGFKALRWVVFFSVE